MAPIVLTPILRSRGLALAVLSAAAVQIALTAVGAPGWPCPLRSLLGIPCPGCGLSTAMAAFLRGDWRTSWSSHPFAPIALLALGAVGSAVVLPRRGQEALAATVEAVETRTFVAALVLAGLIAFWLIRLWHAFLPL